MKKVLVSMGQQKAQARVEVVNETVWILLNGHSFAIEPLKDISVSSEDSVLGANDLVLRAPMPGKVTKIVKSVGDTLEAGDIVFVMEAMKMEYSVTAKRDGVVSKVFVELNQAVALGEELGRLDE